jgi:hypothetical protein
MFVAGVAAVVIAAVPITSKRQMRRYAEGRKLIGIASSCLTLRVPELFVLVAGVFQ